MKTSEPRAWMTPDAVAKKLGLGRKIIIDLIYNKELIAYDMRSPGSSIPRWRIDWNDVKEWMKTRRNVPAAKQPQMTRAQIDSSHLAGILDPELL